MSVDQINSYTIARRMTHVFFLSYAGPFDLNSENTLDGLGFGGSQGL